MTLEALSKKTKLSVSVLEDIIVTDHVIECLTPKSKLKTIRTSLAGDNLKFVNSVAKQLKVHPNSVIVSALLAAVKAENLKAEYARFNAALSKEPNRED